MFYNVSMGTPDKDGPTCWPLQIEVWPEWRDLVAAANITQAMANKAVENLGRRWLDAC